ncbi:phage holin family protein [Methylobacterium gnaphalii]|uniref:Phage holin family protein n=1 Tax=Methylobacterium gnaphalii TaxID=1010610 RepID=A0A512JRK4_9HYPH|nr:phage holin family protein [Methylobacterium gnaphalii]GEP12513.1 hypothetical protein MGN01_43580 [Methylobacterium gnaphalii]GJD70489.1 hypothetical protein MMMDOFMJ_3438 [Methylobacterium gnaphalii]GLS51474.1 hypothetical protein GCM10007885_43310 [Methylobacterium gnaphalii]
MTGPRPRTVPQLVGDTIREAQNLVSKEIDLFRTEVSGGLRQLAVALTLLITAGVFALSGLLVLILALVKGLAVLLHSEVQAALMVGGGFGVIALGLALWGRSKTSLSGLEPKHTEAQMKQDSGIITERFEQ